MIRIKNQLLVYDIDKKEKINSKHFQKDLHVLKRFLNISSVYYPCKFLIYI